MFHFVLVRFSTGEPILESYFESLFMGPVLVPILYCAGCKEETVLEKDLTERSLKREYL